TLTTTSYDGDGVSISDTNSDGVPDAPSSTLRRAKSENFFDERGRVYRTVTYSVDPATGNTAANYLTSDIWYDKRGQVIKQQSPGGPVSKTFYDGAGRI